MEYGNERVVETRVVVEAILLQSDKNNLHIQLDETSKPFWIPRSGIKLTSAKAKQKAEALYVHLKLTENKALTYGLI